MDDKHFSKVSELQTILLEGPSDADRAHALNQLTDFVGGLDAEDREEICGFFVDQLRKEKISERRGWLISALGFMCRGEDVLVPYLSRRHEPSKYVRFWTAVALARVLDGAAREERLLQAVGDQSQHVRAVALRLLIEVGYLEYSKRFMSMLRSDKAKRIRAACNALRNQAGVGGAFDDGLMRDIIGILEIHVQNTNLPSDVRRQAVLAYGDLIDPIQAHAIWVGKLLREILLAEQIDEPDEQLICAFLALLQDIDEPVIQDVLLELLRQDRLSETVTYRAIEVLRSLLGVDGSLQVIITKLFNEDQPSQNLIRALTQIDRAQGEVLISHRLNAANQQVAARAYQLLVALGEETSVLTLHAERQRSMERYEMFIQEIDLEVTRHFQQLASDIHSSFKITQIVFAIFVAFLAFLLIAGLFVSVFISDKEFQRYVGLAVASLSAVFIVALFYKNPLRSVRKSIVDFGKNNIMFVGYIRQLRQIDLIFRQIFMHADTFGMQDVGSTIQQVRKATEETMVAMSDMLDEFDDLTNI